MKRPDLYWNKICPFVHRAWIAAIEKQVDPELEHIELGDGMPEWYTRDVNPAGTVPTLRTEDGKLVFESLYIAQYLDERYGQKGALQPGDSLMKYRSRLFIQQSGDVVGTLYGLLSSGEGEERAAAVEKAKKGLDKWEQTYTAESDGPFFFGTTFSMVDIAIVPFLDRFRYTLKTYCNFDIFEGRPRLEKLMRAASARPSLTTTMQNPSLYVKAYQGYAKDATKATIPKMRLFSHPIAAFADIPRIALHLKQATNDVEVVDVDMFSPPAWYKELNPNGQVPALEAEVGKPLLIESQLITEFLDETLSTGLQLKPADPQLLADTRFFLYSMEESKSSFFGARYTKAGPELEKSQEAFRTDLKFLDSLLQRQHPTGPFFLGEEPTLADVCAIPFLARYEATYTTIVGAPSFAESYSRIAKTITAARAHPGFSPVLRSIASYLE